MKGLTTSLTFFIFVGLNFANASTVKIECSNTANTATVSIERIIAGEPSMRVTYKGYSENWFKGGIGKGQWQIDDYLDSCSKPGLSWSYITSSVNFTDSFFGWANSAKCSESSSGTEGTFLAWFSPGRVPGAKPSVIPYIEDLECSYHKTN